jgi:hypothetical protein
MVGAVTADNVIIAGILTELGVRADAFVTECSISRCGRSFMTSIRYWAGVVALLVMAAIPAQAQQTPAAGRIKVVSGSAFILHEGKLIPAQVGQDVFAADALRTGNNGRIGVTLKDDTRISLGPSSEVRLERFNYATADGGLALVLKVVRGAAAYVSGRIAKLAPDSIRLETPAAIVGVRGTSLAIRVGR